MTEKHLAVIDIGTNTFKMKITDINGRPIDRAIYNLVCNSDENLNLLNEYQINKNFEIYKEILSEYDIAPDSPYLKVLATEGVRRASNSKSVIANIEEKTGFKIAIISAEKEAELSVKGAVSTFDNITSKYILFIDIGGGSTEVVLVENNQDKTIKAMESIGTGSRKLCNDMKNSKPNYKSLTRSYASKMISEGVDNFVQAVDGDFKKDVFLVVNSSALLNIIRKQKGANPSDGDGLGNISIKDLKEHLQVIQRLGIKDIVDEGYLGDKFKAKFDLGIEKPFKIHQFKEAVYILEKLFDNLDLPNNTNINVSVGSTKDGAILEFVQEYKNNQKIKLNKPIRDNTISY